MKWITGKLISAFLLIFICFSILYKIYGPIMIHPNKYMLCDDGEAMRNYYVMCYQLQSKKDWMEFKGLNYPYGQHLTYSDGQPFNTAIAKIMGSFCPGFKEYGVGWINIISLYSLILGALLLFLALTELKLPYLFAIIIAIALMMISPQVWRMKWQHALAISCFVPSIFFLLVKVVKTGGIGWNILLLFNGIIWFLVHPYLGFMHSLFLAIYLFVQWIKFPKFRIKSFIYHSFLVTIPLAVFYLFLLLTDIHTQRESNPSGIVQSSSFLDSVFISPFAPFTKYYVTWFNIDTKKLMLHLDGSAYLGVSAILFLIFILLGSGWLIIQKRKASLDIPQFISIALIASLFMMFIAFALPFKLFPETKTWLDLVPPLKQFRSVGRFSWFAVYAIHIYAGYFIWMQIKRASQPVLKGGLIIIFFSYMGLIIYEGSYIHAYAAKTSHTENVLRSNAALNDTLQNAIHSVQPEMYQAIVPLPYFYADNQSFSQPSYPTADYLTDVFVFSQRTHLPLTAGYAARNSKWESINSFQFFSDDMFEKKISRDMGKKDLLVYYDQSIGISPQEQRIVKLGDTLYSKGNILLLKLDPAEVFKQHSADYINYFEEHIGDFKHEGTLYLKPNSLCIKESYDDLSVPGFRGNCTEINPEKKEVFFDQRNYCPDFPEGMYKMSFWFKHTENQSLCKLQWKVTDRGTGKLIEIIDAIWATRTLNILDEWMLCEFDIYLNPRKNFELYFVNETDATINKVQIDELLIRQEPFPVYEQTRNGEWFWNNRPLHD